MARFHRATITPTKADLIAVVVSSGITLEDRWGGWDRSPFTGDSESHVSVWRRPTS